MSDARDYAEHHSYDDDGYAPDPYVPMTPAAVSARATSRPEREALRREHAVLYRAGSR